MYGFSFCSTVFPGMFKSYLLNVIGLQSISLRDRALKIQVASYQPNITCRKMVSGKFLNILVFPSSLRIIQALQPRINMNFLGL